MAYRIRDAVDWLSNRIPLATAASWDNVGFLLGDLEAPLHRVATCLTLTPQTAKEALDYQANLVLVHHPILFKGTKSLVASHPKEKLLLDLIQGKVAVYSPHTAWDNAPGGINEQLLMILGVSRSQPLRRSLASESVKIVVFVPPGERESVAQAMFTQGAGNIGNYSACSFRLPGTGTFCGNEKSNPKIGRKEANEEVTEERLEIVCRKKDLARVIWSLRQSHPYEEPAFDLIPLLGDPTGAFGEGRIGDLLQPTPLGDLAYHLARGVGIQQCHTIGPRDQTISKIAVACGAAGEFLKDAIQQRADLFVTGELRYHEALEAQEAGIGVIVLGHHASEHFAMRVLGEELIASLGGVETKPCLEIDPLEGFELVSPSRLPL